jgi:hypothetical protein
VLFEKWFTDNINSGSNISVYKETNSLIILVKSYTSLADVPKLESNALSLNNTLNPLLKVLYNSNILLNPNKSTIDEISVEQSGSHIINIITNYSQEID